MTQINIVNALIFLFSFACCVLGGPVIVVDSVDDFSVESINWNEENMFSLVSKDADSEHGNLKSWLLQKENIEVGTLNVYYAKGGLDVLEKNVNAMMSAIQVNLERKVLLETPRKILWSSVKDKEGAELFYFGFLQYKEGFLICEFIVSDAHECGTWIKRFLEKVTIVENEK